MTYEIFYTKMFVIHCKYNSGRNIRDGGQRLLHWWRGTEPEGRALSELPRGARRRHKLGRHGEDLAPHLLQRTASGTRGTPCVADRGPTEPQGQQGDHDPGQILFTVLILIVYILINLDENLRDQDRFYFQRELKVKILSCFWKLLPCR
mgnify:CR=1 FL=1